MKMPKDTHLIDAFDAGAELHGTQPELMLCEVGRRATSRYPSDEEAGEWFVDGYKAARAQRDEFQQERAAS